MAQKVRERARCYEPNRARFDDLNLFFFFFSQGELELRECKYVDIPARWIDSSVAVK